jgi:hypothetical protein
MHARVCNARRVNRTRDSVISAVDECVSAVETNGNSQAISLFGKGPVVHFHATIISAPAD